MHDQDAGGAGLLVDLTHDFPGLAFNLEGEERERREQKRVAALAQEACGRTRDGEDGGHIFFRGQNQAGEYTVD